VGELTCAHSKTITNGHPASIVRGPCLSPGCKWFRAVTSKCHRPRRLSLLMKHLVTSARTNLLLLNNVDLVITLLRGQSPPCSPEGQNLLEGEVLSIMPPRAPLAGTR
jgi:hypothetical protein